MHPPRPLPRSFFLPSPDLVGRALVGKLLLRRHAGQLLVGRVVETEAYFGEGDAAAHSAAGRTERNAVLWGEPGHAYVYLSYGMHWCLNVSCEPAGQAGCVLFRAVEPVEGVETMRALRGGLPLEKLAAGPGRLCAALGLTRAESNGADMTDAGGALWLGDDGARAPELEVTPRVGITKDAGRLARFVAAGSRFASRVPRQLASRN
jgi:DNA-3-methyladenine glycosylase